MTERGVGSRKIQYHRCKTECNAHEARDAIQYVFFSIVGLVSITGMLFRYLVDRGVNILYCLILMPHV